MSGIITIICGNHRCPQSTAVLADSGWPLALHTIRTAIRSRIARRTYVLMSDPAVGAHLAHASGQFWWSEHVVHVTSRDFASSVDQVAGFLRFGWPNNKRLPVAVVMLSAGQPLVPADAMRQVVADHLVSCADVTAMTTPIRRDSDRWDADVVKVAVSDSGRVLYASGGLSLAGHSLAGHSPGHQLALRHCGVEVYSVSALMRLSEHFAEHGPCGIEEAERTELMRSVEMRLNVRASVVSKCPNPVVNRERFEEALPILVRRRIRTERGTSMTNCQQLRAPALPD